MIDLLDAMQNHGSRGHTTWKRSSSGESTEGEDRSLMHATTVLHNGGMLMVHGARSMW